MSQWALARQPAEERDKHLLVSQTLQAVLQRRQLALTALSMQQPSLFVQPTVEGAAKGCCIGHQAVIDGAAICGRGGLHVGAGGGCAAMLLRVQG